MGAQYEEKMNYRMEYAQGQIMLYNVGIGVGKTVDLHELGKVLRPER